MGRKEDKKPARKDFGVPNPVNEVKAYIQAAAAKYKLKAEGYEFRDIKDMKPVFAFDYLSLNSGDLCFNNGGLVKEDYIGLLTGLRKVSEHTYETLSNTPAFRFHKINFNDKRYSVGIKLKDFKECITNKPEDLSDDEMPNLWQFDLQYVQAARVAGFLYKGVFYLVWYDRHHKIYPKK